MVLSMSRLLARSVDMLVEGTSLSHQGFELSVCGSDAGPVWSLGEPPPSPSSCCTC